MTWAATYAHFCRQAVVSKSQGLATPRPWAQTASSPPFYCHCLYFICTFWLLLSSCAKEMEFPDLGKNCTRKDCNRLDFLPFKCQYCKRPFCENHWKVEQHDCPQKHLVVDMRVPDCPLCGAVVSLRRGEDPNIAVDAHIRAGCKMVSSTPPAYKSNACAYKRCHDKVLVLTKCPYCQLSFCLKHRFEGDHDCTRRGSSAPPAANGPKTGGMLKNIVPMKKGVSVGPGSRSGGKAGAAKSKDSNCIIS